ncbi:hypothetical protein [Nocardioides sp.]|uniref:hypothetical protein n=1 Tax=Nocardioides sp. TaxID=35761 RepID=UPI00356573AC
MKVEEYVAARYGRLLEYAVELGAPEGLAHEYVDQVLLDQQRAIRRAEDPDPVVRAALEEAIRGPRREGRSPWPLVGGVLGAIAVLVALTLTMDPYTEPMPSLFGHTGPEAQELLEGEGYEVVLRPLRACEPLDLVLGSQPPTGAPVESGAVISVFTAVPSGSECEARYPLREEAWGFLRFAVTGSPRPQFAVAVDVFVDGVLSESLSGTAASTPEWAQVRELVATAATRPADNATGQAEVRIIEAVPPLTTCGHPRPEPRSGQLRALRISVDGRGDAGFGCPLTIDLYRNVLDAINVIAIYTELDPPDAS